MKAELAFSKAAKKLGVNYLGLKRGDQSFLYGYFESAEGNIVRSFAFGSIKAVAESVQANIEEGRYQENGDEIRNYFKNI